MNNTSKILAATFLLFMGCEEEGRVACSCIGPHFDIWISNAENCDTTTLDSVKVVVTSSTQTDTIEAGVDIPCKKEFVIEPPAGMKTIDIMLSQRTIASYSVTGTVMTECCETKTLAPEINAPYSNDTTSSLIITTIREGYPY